jgi:NADPH-dependent curcumin reductase CurA
MNPTYQRIVLARRPKGELQVDDLLLETCATADLLKLEENQVLVRNQFLSIDPYMRVRMDDVKNYAPPQAIGATMIGGTVGVVIASRSPDFNEGDCVSGMFGWTEMGVLHSTMLRKLSPNVPSLSLYLGVLGMPGVTAWYGVNKILNLQAGQTVLISAAAGAVGSLVGQLAKLQSCKVVGIAGGAHKTGFLCGELGFDAAVDYKTANWDGALIKATEDGVDALFENVGGAIFDAALSRLNPQARIALCGMISRYQSDDVPLKNARFLLSMRAYLQAFIITEHLDVWPQAQAEMLQLLKSSQLHYKETIAEGLALAPHALIGLLKGGNLGKQIVQLY